MGWLLKRIRMLQFGTGNTPTNALLTENSEYFITEDGYYLVQE